MEGTKPTPRGRSVGIAQRTTVLSRVAGAVRGCGGRGGGWPVEAGLGDWSTGPGEALGEGVEGQGVVGPERMADGRGGWSGWITRAGWGGEALFEGELLKWVPNSTRGHLPLCNC